MTLGAPGLRFAYVAGDWYSSTPAVWNRFDALPVKDENLILICRAGKDQTQQSERR